LFTKPKTNSSFWETKVKANRERDERKERALVEAGFRVAVVWQCELEAPSDLEARLAQFLNAAGTTRSQP
jgi:G:T-mismatch repair DNA endonuclease (very short patch repair protein)